MIARGQFDATALCNFLGKLVPKSRRVEGSNVFEINDDTVLLVSSDRRIVFLSREPTGDLALETMATALKKSVGTFSENAELAKLARSVDITKPVWAAGRISPGFGGNHLGRLGSLTRRLLLGQGGWTIRKIWSWN